MPSIGSGLSVLHYGHSGVTGGGGGVGSGGIYDDNRCGCCPYGYHIDVDFVPFTRKMLSRESEVERLEALKDKWRCERQSMDKLLGVVVKQKLASRQQQEQDGLDESWSANNIRRRIEEERSSSWLSQVRSVGDIEYHRQQRRYSQHHKHPADTSFTTTEYTCFSSGFGGYGGDGGEQDVDAGTSHDSILLGNGLSEAITDFEEALSRTRPEARTLSYSIPDSHKFHTFPRIKASGGASGAHREGASREAHDTSAIGLMSVVGGFSSNQYNKGSTTSTSASTVIMKEISTTSASSATTTMPAVAQVVTPPIPPKESKVVSEPTNGISTDRHHHHADSIYSHSFQPNGYRREGGEGESDKRLEYLEEQVKIIPELEVKLTLLKEEKRQLMKLLDNEKQKSAKLEEKERVAASAAVFGREEKKVSPVAPPRRKTRDAGVGRTVLTRDVGISHTMPRTRSVGVGGNADYLLSSGVLERSSSLSRPDSCSPTGSIPSSTTGTIRRRIRSFDVGVQVKEHEFKDASDVTILQIVEKVDCGVQTLPIKFPDEPDRSLRKPRPKLLTKSTGSLAKPRMDNIGCTAKPTCKDIGVGTPPEKKVKDTKSTRTVGVSAKLLTPESSQSRGSSPEKPTILRKLTKSSGVNTEQPRLKTTSTNTLPSTFLPSQESSPRAPFESPYISTRLTVPTPSPTPQTPADSEGEREPTPVPREPEDYKIIREPSSVARHSPSPTPSPPPPPPKPSIQATPPLPAAPPALSQVDSKSLSRIPRLAGSPTSPRLAGRRFESPVDEDLRSGRTTPEESRSSMSPVPPSPPQQHVPLSGIPLMRKPVFQRSDTFTKEIHFPIGRYPPCQLEPLEEEDKERPSTSGSFASLQEPREKVVPSKEMQGALKVLNDALLRGRTTQQVTSAISIILHEWFRVAGTKTANPLDVEDYLDFFESYSPQLLRYIVNMPDGNGNTAMHYAVSHGNFDVVSILLDSKVCDPNKANKAGYTSVMLVSLAKILTETHRQVVRRLFSLGDVNIKAAQHGQTALMLGASHGRLDTVKLLIEAGADVNIQDEDGSTALMCAAEHGHGDIVKYLLAQSDCDPNVTDNDGSTALSVAMEAGHKDIGVMLYAHMHFLKGPQSSPTATSTSPTSFQKHSSSIMNRSSTPSSRNSQSESPSSSTQTSPLVAKKHNQS